MGDGLEGGGITSLVKRRSGAGRLIPYVGRTQWVTIHTHASYKILYSIC